MDGRGSSRSGLFLIELMIAILIFAICGAICLQMFAYSSQRVKSAEELRHACLSAKSVAECHRAMEGDLEAVAEIVSGTVTYDGLWVGYDSQWQTVDSQPTYVLELAQQGSCAQISVFATDAGDGSIYDLVVGGGT